MRKLLIAAVVLTAYGCAGREHMSPNFGKSVRAAFAAQVIRPDAGKDARPLPGLDPQEASAVADTYFKSLTPEKAAAKKSPPLLVVEPEPEPSKLPPPMGGPK